MYTFLELIDYIRFRFRRIFRRQPPPELGPPGQTFPLVGLPLIPLLMVIQNMDLCPILSLSAQSTKFKNIAKLHTRKMPVRYRSKERVSFSTYEYYLEDDPSPERYFAEKVEIKPRCVRDNRAWWDVVWNKPQKLLHVNGCPFYFEDFHRVLLVCHGRIRNCLFGEFPEAINDFLLDMLMGQPFDVSLDIKNRQFPPLLCINEPFRCVSLYQQDDILIMPSMLQRLLEDLTITEKLFVNWKVPEELRYTKGLRYPKMTLQNAHWLTLESILHMKCVYLDAQGTRLTDHDVNKIIKKVIDGGLDGLKRIILHSGLRWSETVLLEGIDWKPLNRRVPIRSRRENALIEIYTCSVGMTGKNGRRIAFGYNTERGGGEILAIYNDLGQR